MLAQKWSTTVDMDKEKFRKRFPTLSEEVEDGVMGVPVEDEGDEDEEAPKTTDPSESSVTQKKPVKGYDGYDPTAVDFIRRCGSEKEAHEIIEYMEQKGEIGRSEAQRMRSQLRSKGLRSFGAKKEYGHYLKSLD